MITAMDLQVIEDKPRVQDLKVAERLEFEAPYRIRDLIKRNEARLSKRGNLLTTIVKSGGRPATEYWLTKWQAIKICMWSEAPNADAVQDEIADVFDAYTDGKLVVPGQAPITTEVISQLFEPIRTTVERTYKVVEGTAGSVVQLLNSSARIEQRMLDAIPRREPSEKNQRIYRHTIVKRYGGFCPCGCRKPILDESGNVLLDQSGKALLEFDHWYTRERNGLEAMWPVHSECNDKLKDDDYRRSKHHRFVVFHEERKTVENDLRHHPKLKRSKKTRCQLTPDFLR